VPQFCPSFFLSPRNLAPPLVTLFSESCRLTALFPVLPKLFPLPTDIYFPYQIAQHSPASLFFARYPLSFLSFWWTDTIPLTSDVLIWCPSTHLPILVRLPSFLKSPCRDLTLLLSEFEVFIISETSRLPFFFPYAFVSLCFDSFPIAFP